MRDRVGEAGGGGREPQNWGQWPGGAGVCQFWGYWAVCPWIGILGGRDSGCQHDCSGALLEMGAASEAGGEESQPGPRLSPTHAHP